MTESKATSTTGGASTPMVPAVIQTSEALDKLFGALSKAQGEAKDVPMDGTNPYFGSKYATLGSVVDMARPVLAKNGLSLPIFPCGSGATFVLAHTSGQFISGRIDIPEGQTERNSGIQQLGSALTYLRRYILTGILGVVGDEDLDGNAPVQEGKKKPSAKKAQNGNITDAQRRMLFGRAQEAGWEGPSIKAALKKKFGYESTSDITKTRLDQIVDFFSKSPAERKQDAEA